ncbi:MAG: peptide chain release factor 2 [Bacilli bacterium]|nr:peptide chain release factor 2 [Bacilli bacterium]
MDNKDVLNKIDILSDKVNQYGGYFDIDLKKEQVSNLEKETLDPNFWNRDDSSDVLKIIGDNKRTIDNITNIKNELDSYKELIEIDDSYVNDISESIVKLEQDIEKLELETKLSGEYDKNNAILELHSGAGGTESCDWVSMLLRMYERWCERNNYKYEILDQLDGEEAGIKRVTVLVKGINAYGYLKCERGVHRLVRISPFDSNKRRHTSFASVEVTPEVDDSINIDIKEQDLRIDVYRSTGAGGQGVNTTDSAVRITHLPTGIVVTCQNERSQLKNKELAMKVLKAKLFALEEEKKNKEKANLIDNQSDINFGSQIRSYVMHPYSMVKDHRTNYEKGDVYKVMDGYIDEFIEEYLKGGAK